MTLNRIISGIFLMLFALPAPAQESRSDKFEGMLNKLLAPGPLMKGHEQLEHTDCLECHEPGGGVPNTKCMDCHTEIGQQVRARKSFHGRMKTKQCIECHKDHQGRSYDSTKVNENRFNHDRTGFRLDGAHRKVKCAECHTDKRSRKVNRPGQTRYFGTSPSCIGCHKEDDIHFFTGKFAKVECSECHNTSSWKQALKFNHRQETGYALIGKHARISCNECHAPNGPRSAKYDWPELKTKQCLSCHKDHHGNKLSPRFRNGNCAQCHNQNTWNIGQFDHRVTTFPLRGKHARVQCIDCHKQTPQTARSGKENYNWTGLRQNCSSCHADYHGFNNRVAPKLGNLMKCQTCHNEVAWKHQIRFNHDTQTRWPITGKHRQNRCFDCHEPVRKSKRPRPNTPREYFFPELPKKSCETCHKSAHSKAFHRRFQGVTCDSCHTTAGWNIMKSTGAGGLLGGDRKFHQKTRFPLTGQHLKVPCNECHKVNGKQVYRFPNAKKKFCVTCHDNVHKKQFLPRTQRKSCAECHRTSSFKKRLPFNHDKTRFKLTGRHAKIEKNCGACHKPSSKVVLLTKPPRRGNQYVFPGEKRGFCDNCHVNQHKDMFKPRFYRQPCYECHTTSTFEKRKFFNHNSTDFALRYKHKRVNCRECHVPTRKRYRTKPFHRKGKYQFPEIDRLDCAACHEDVHKGANGPNCSRCHTERGWKFADEFHKDFTLTGVHLNLGCDQCHINNRMLRGSSEDCMLCHVEDDIHHGSLPNCKECHTQTFWEATTFNHNMTLFPLQGAHRLTDCRACHNQGVYQGQPLDCQSCHFKDALLVIDPDHANPRFQDCKLCHNPFSFKGATGQ